MAAHLLLEVATGGAPVSRDELHARMRRFGRLLVLRPDGYLVKATSGVAVQKAGVVVLADDGTLRAGRFEVGPFYAQARRQLLAAAGRPIRWHVAEPRMVTVLRKHFEARGFHSIEVVYTQPVK